MSTGFVSLQSQNIRDRMKAITGLCPPELPRRMLRVYTLVKNYSGKKPTTLFIFLEHLIQSEPIAFIGSFSYFLNVVQY